MRKGAGKSSREGQRGDSSDTFFRSLFCSRRRPEGHRSQGDVPKKGGGRRDERLTKGAFPCLSVQEGATALPKKCSARWGEGGRGACSRYWGQLESKQKNDPWSASEGEERSEQLVQRKKTLFPVASRRGV